MRWRIVVPMVLLALLVVVPIASAAAFNWGMGANLGFNMFTPDSKYKPDNKTITTYGWPVGGLRFSFAGEKPMHEVYLETELSYLSVQDGGSDHNFMVSGNYQFNFDMKGPAVPYLTAGVGVDMVGSKPPTGDSRSANAIFYGGGVGIAHHMGNGCGRLRAELRYDMIGEGKKTIAGHDDVIIDKGGQFGVKLGFDLWDKK
jgi:hypothetical protein